MNNIIKMLSINKEFRMVIADTQRIAEKELGGFSGTDCIHKFLEQFITNCTLFSAVNDFGQKISFTLRLAQNITISCKIANLKFSIEYTANLNEFGGTVADLFDDKSVLSITSGDWDIGLQTGIVEAHIDNVDMLFAHFMVQSEQLPSHFIMAEDHPTRGLLMQPLPFANEELLSKYDDELLYLSKNLGTANFEDVASIYSHLATVISESKIDREPR